MWIEVLLLFFLLLFCFFFNWTHETHTKISIIIILFFVSADTLVSELFREKGTRK